MKITNFACRNNGKGTSLKKPPPPPVYSYCSYIPIYTVTVVIYLYIHVQYLENETMIFMIHWYKVQAKWCQKSVQRNT